MTPKPVEENGLLEGWENILVNGFTSKQMLTLPYQLIQMFEKTFECVPPDSSICHCSSKYIEEHRQEFQCWHRRYDIVRQFFSELNVLRTTGMNIDAFINWINQQLTRTFEEFKALEYPDESLWDLFPHNIIWRILPFLSFSLAKEVSPSSLDSDIIDCFLSSMIEFKMFNEHSWKFLDGIRHTSQEAGLTKLMLFSLIYNKYHPVDLKEYLEQSTAETELPELAIIIRAILQDEPLKIIDIPYGKKIVIDSG